MEIITSTSKVYGASELVGDARDKMLDKYRFINVEPDTDGWADSLIEYHTDILEKRGYADIKILYSGFGS
jgi:hypothetical protein